MSQDNSMKPKGRPLTTQKKPKPQGIFSQSVGTNKKNENNLAQMQLAGGSRNGKESIQPYDNRKSGGGKSMQAMLGDHFRK